MARRNRSTYAKRVKEVKRKQKAEEKMARRHGKAKREADGSGFDVPEKPEEQHEKETEA
jgi:hypothetical protein